MNVPRLRFKTFSGDWEDRPLSEIVGRLESGVSVNSEDVAIRSPHEYGILKTSCITDGYFFAQENKKIIPSEIARAKLNPAEDSIIVSRMNTPQLVGEVGYVTKSYPNLFIPDRLWLIEVKNKSRDSTKWLSQQLTTKYLKNVLTNIATGTSGSMKNIAQPNFLSIELSTPEFAEQTKIANFLTAVDEKIAQLTQKSDLLARYKKGVMQQIFSQRLRFKDDDGQEFPDWEEKELGELCSITTGKLDANAMVENGQYRFYTCAKEYYQIDKYAFDTDALLVSGNGANVGYIHHYKGKFNAYQRTYVLDGFEQNIIFVRYFLDANLYARIFKEKKDGNTPYIVLGTLTEMKVSLPRIPEQSKIASFLTAIDDKIIYNQTQLNALKQYKQGLLQQLFV